MKAKDFLAKYSCLAAKDPTPLPTDPKQAVASIMRSLHLPETEWQIGKTKVHPYTFPYVPLHVVPPVTVMQCRCCGYVGTYVFTQMM